MDHDGEAFELVHSQVENFEELEPLPSDLKVETTQYSNLTAIVETMSKTESNKTDI